MIRYHSCIFAAASRKTSGFRARGGGAQEMTRHAEKDSSMTIFLFLSFSESVRTPSCADRRESTGEDRADVVSRQKRKPINRSGEGGEESLLWDP